MGRGERAQRVWVHDVTVSVKVAHAALGGDLENYFFFEVRRNNFQGPRTRCVSIDEHLVVLRVRPTASK